MFVVYGAMDVLAWNDESYNFWQATINYLTINPFEL